MKKSFGKKIVVTLLALALVATSLSGTFFASEPEIPSAPVSMGQDISGQTSPSNDDVAPVSSSLASSQQGVSSGTATGPTAPDTSAVVEGPVVSGESSVLPEAPVSASGSSSKPTASSMERPEIGISAGPAYDAATLLQNPTRYFSQLQLFSRDAALTPGAATVMEILLASTIGSDGYVYRNVEVRAYLDATGLAYIKDPANSLKGSFGYAGYYGTSAFVDDGTAPYLSFKIPEITSMAGGTLSFPVELMKGLVPEGVSFLSTASIYYAGDSGIYEKILDSAPLSLPVNSVLAWNGAVAPNPTSFDMQRAGGAYNKALSFTTTFSPASTSNYYADRFEIESILSVPTEVTIDTGSVSVSIGGRVLASTEYTLTPVLDGYQINLTYDPAAATPAKEAANFSLVVSFGKFSVDTSGVGVDYGSTFPIKLTSTATVTGEEGSAQPVAINEIKNTITLKIPALDPSRDANLDDVTINKTRITTELGQGFSDGDLIQFKIDGIVIAPTILSTNAVLLEDFTITDHNFDAGLNARSITLGKYTDKTGAIAPKTIDVVIKGRTYQYIITSADVTAGVVNFDATFMLAALHIESDVPTGLTAEGSNANNITSICVGFGDVYSDFKMLAINPMLIDFEVGYATQADGHTMINMATVDFTNMKDQATKEQSYTRSATAEAQYKGNEKHKLETAKEMKNLTSGRDDIAAPGETIQYTLKMKNTAEAGAVSANVLNPYITDLLPTAYLDLASLEVVSLSYPDDTDASRDPGDFTLQIGGAEYAYTNLPSPLDGDSYTSKTTNGNTTDYKWGFTGTFYPGESIEIVFTATLKSLEELENTIGYVNGQKFLLNKAIYGGDDILIEDEHLTDVPAIVAQPFVNYALNLSPSSQNSFVASAPKVFDFVVDMSNKENKYEGSADIYALDLAGRLPSGFYFEVDIANLAPTAALFSISHPRFTAADSNVAMNGSDVVITYTDATSATLYTVTLSQTGGVYNRYIFNMAGNVNDDTTAVLNYNGPNRDAAEESMQLLFSARSPKDSIGFSGNGSDKTFQVATRLYAWAREETATIGDYQLRNLNTSETMPGYRYSAAAGKSVNYTNDSAQNWDGNTATLGALEDSVYITGTLDSPVVSLYKGASATTDLVGGREVTYYVYLYNYSAQPLNLQEIVLADVLPIGQTYVPGSLTVKDNKNEAAADRNKGNAGTIAAAVTNPSQIDTVTNGTLLSFGGVGGTLQGRTYSDAGGTGISTAILTLSYRAIVNNDCMNPAQYNGSIYQGLVHEYSSRMYVHNTAALLLTGENVKSMYQSTGSTPAKITAKVAAQELGYNWTNGQMNTGLEYILPATATVNYAQARISPEITKSLATDSVRAVYDDGQELEWRLTLQNTSGATETLLNPVVIDILPKGLEYMPGSTKLGGVAAADPVVIGPSAATEFDFGDGQGTQEATLLVWDLNLALLRGYSNTITYKTEINIGIDTTTPATFINYHDYINRAYLLPGAAQQSLFYSTGTSPVRFVANMDTLLQGYSQAATKFALADALTGSAANYPATPAVKAAMAQSTVGIWGSFVVDYRKYAQQTGDASTRIASDGDSNEYNALPVTLEGTYEHVLMVRNASHANANGVGNTYRIDKLAIIDKLPSLNDTHVINPGQRGSEFRPMLDVTKNVMVYLVDYDIKGNETARAILEASYIEYTQEQPPAEFTPDDWDPTKRANTGTHAVTWLTKDELDPNLPVTSFRVLLTGLGLESNVGVEVVVPMQAPGTIAYIPGQNEYTAWNSFGYKLSSVEYNTLNPDHIITQRNMGPLEAEKVGAAVTAPSNNSMELTKTLLNVDGSTISPSASNAFLVRVENANGYLNNITLNKANNWTQTLEDLPLGPYTVTELADETGTSVNDLYEVKVNGTAGSSTEITLDTISPTPPPAEQIILKNQRKPANLGVTKLVQGTGGAESNGFLFKLLNASDQSVADTQTTANGGTAAFANLPWGEYILVEIAPDGYKPSGFTKDNGTLTGAVGSIPAGHSLYYKNINLPAKLDDGKYSVAYTQEVDNRHYGAFELTKTWNGAATRPDGDAYFVLAPGSGEVSTGITLAATGNKFSAKEIATGTYTLYEITTGRYQPEHAAGWTKLNSSYATPAGARVLWRCDTAVVVSKNTTVQISVNNWYEVASSSSSAPASSSKASSKPGSSSKSSSGAIVSSAVSSSIVPGSSDGGGDGNSYPFVSSAASSRVSSATGASTTSSSGSSGAASGSSSSTLSAPTSATSTPPGGGTSDAASNGATGTGASRSNGITSEMTRQFEAQTGNPLTDLINNNVPLGNLGVGGAWSLLNLMCAILGVLISTILAICIFAKNKNQAEKPADAENPTLNATNSEPNAQQAQLNVRKRSTLWRTITIILGVLTAILFLIFEDITLPMVFINSWSLRIVPVFLLHLTGLLVYNAKGHPAKEQPQEKKPTG